jgi:hypothetical protein
MANDRGVAEVEEKRFHRAMNDECLRSFMGYGRNCGDGRRVANELVWELWKQKRRKRSRGEVL